MITPEELQHLLRQFDALEGVEVVGQVPTILTATVPVTVRGAIKVHGEYYVYDLEVDLKKIKDADAVLDLVGKLKGSFDKIKT